jgi:hypothetical protein
MVMGAFTTAAVVVEVVLIEFSFVSLNKIKTNYITLFYESRLLENFE